MYEKENEQLNRLFPKLVARAWVDEKFKKQLLEEPRKVLAQNGLDLPEDFPLNVVETDAPPSGAQAVAQPLAAAAGAASTVIPPAPFASVGSQSLGPALAGSTSGTAGTAGSFGTVCGTAASLLTAGSAGTAGAAPQSPASPQLTLGTGTTIASGVTFGPQQSGPAGGAQTGAAPGTNLAGTTVGSAGTAGSVATICGTLGSFATAGTAGTAS